jgi:hypothetical protein
LLSQISREAACRGIPISSSFFLAVLTDIDEPP